MNSGILIWDVSLPSGFVPAGPNIHSWKRLLAASRGRSVGTGKKGPGPGGLRAGEWFHF